MEINYRIGTFEDSPHLQRVGLSSYGTFKDALTPDNWAKMHVFLSDEQSYVDLLSKATCFVCEADDVVIGMAFLMPHGNPTDIFDAEWSYIRMVGVDPDFRGHSIAKKLTQLCLNHAIATNEKIVALHTSELMHAARHVYESLGFYRVRELNPLFGVRYSLYQYHITTT